MSIERDIKQANFKSPYSKAVINILRGQHPNPITVIAIIERMLDKMSNASRLVDKLLVKELVVRKLCPHDRRAVDVTITEKGLNHLKELDTLQNQWESKLHGLTENEALQLSTLLDKMRQS